MFEGKCFACAGRPCAGRPCGEKETAVHINGKLEELHAFVGEDVAMFAARSGNSVQTCLVQRNSSDKPWYKFLAKYSGSFNDAQRKRLAEIFNVISIYRTARNPFSTWRADPAGVVAGDEEPSHSRRRTC